MLTKHCALYSDLDAFYPLCYCPVNVHQTSSGQTWQACWSKSPQFQGMISYQRSLTFPVFIFSLPTCFPLILI